MSDISSERPETKEKSAVVCQLENAAREHYGAQALKRGIPDYMINALVDYVVFGVAPGNFLGALLSNDLMETYRRADDTNIDRIRNYVMFLYNDAPAACSGSHQRFGEWIQREGLRDQFIEAERRSRK